GEKVFFDLDKATLQKRSYSILSQVAQVLRANPQLKVRVEGHTDSQGTVEHNEKLSQARSESVREYLIKQHVAADRLVAKGYGPPPPAEDEQHGEGARSQPARGVRDSRREHPVRRHRTAAVDRPHRRKEDREDGREEGRRKESGTRQERREEGRREKIGT